MTDKPLLTLDDFMMREQKRVDSMSEEERAEYWERIQHAQEIADELGMQTVDLFDTLGSDDEIPYVTLDNIGTVVSGLMGEFTLKCCPSGGKKSKWKNKLYIAAAVEDYATHLDQICEWFGDDTIDIYYSDEANCPAGIYDQLISPMNGMVVIVTDRFLSDDCRAKNVDIGLARKYDIPIIPVYFDGSIQAFNEQVGNIELINTREGDFVRKIRTQLNQCMATGSLFERIRQEYRAHMFLSYRKKDIRLAKELLGLLKRDPRFWDVSVWYDDYLTPGEDYDDEIESRILGSDVFLLLATPNLLEENNYVQKYEYPLACRAGKPIIAIEAETVDLQALQAQYEHIPDLITGNDGILQVIVEALGLDRRPIADEIEHRYYMALAYFWGIGVDKNRDYALELLVDCVNHHYVPAIHFIASTPAYYRDLSMDKRIEVFEYAIREIEGEFSQQNFDRLSEYWCIANTLTTTYFSARRYDDEIELIEKMRGLCPRLSLRIATVQEEQARLSFRLAMVYDTERNYSAAAVETDRAARQIHQLMEMDVANKPYSLYLLISVCELKQIARSMDLKRFDETYERVMVVYNALEDERQRALALEYAQFVQNYATYLFLFNDHGAKERAYEAAHYAIDLFSELPNVEMARSMISVLYSHLANHYFQDRNREKAIEAAEKAVEYARDCTLYSPATADEALAKSLFNCANICFQFDSYEKAEQYFIETVRLCLSGGEPRNIEIFRYACDYYAQLLVILERYDEAIQHYNLFIHMMTRNHIDTDQVLEYCAQFAYRIGMIALDYMENDELAAIGLQNAIFFIESIENVSYEMMEFRDMIMNMFEE